METILRSVVTSQGVIGGMIANDSGQLLVRSLPDMYDSDQLGRVCALLMEQQLGLEDATGGVRQAEVRFELGKLIARSAGERLLVLLCEPGANVQMLLIALNVAAKKLEKLPHVPANQLAASGKKEARPAEVRKDSGIPAAYRNSGLFG